MKKITVFVLCAAAMAAPQLCLAGNRIADDFAQACRELDSLIYERTSVTGELQIKAVMKRGRTLDFYFTNSLSDLPWKYGDSEWFRKELESRFPEQYKGYRLGRISSRGEKIENLETGSLHSGGEPVTASYRLKNHTVPGRSIVERSGDQAYPDGLDGRHIALWQSHGLYYNNSEGIWKWQRPCLFQTVEDLFTQSFVLPFLVPMLENAGAYVFLPRERDLQTCEIIIDNDPDFRTDSSLVPTAAADGRMRLAGDFSETGPWKDAGAGFADAKMYYGGTDNPFTMGSARMADCIPGGKDPDKLAETVWTPDIPKRGEYAVYVSYKSLPNSTSAAHYTVRHLGGTSEFYVDQRMGGGMWIYLGTFCFAPGCGFRTLENRIQGQGRRVHAFHCLHDAAQPGSLHPLVPHNEQSGTCQQSHCDNTAVSVSGFRGFHAETADDEHPRYLSGCCCHRRCRTSAFFHHGVPAHVQDCTRDACDNNLNECME